MANRSQTVDGGYSVGEYDFARLLPEEASPITRHASRPPGLAASLPRILDGAGNPLTDSAIGNLYLFSGRRYDPESGNYYYRARMYSP